MSEPPSLRGTFFQRKEGDTRMPLSLYRHFERKREIFFIRDRSGKVRTADNGKHRTLCDVGSRCFMQTALRRKTANGKRKRSLGCARDDETRKRFPPIPFQSRAEANLCPFGAPPSRGRREHPREPLPLEGAAEHSEAGLAFFFAAKPPPLYLPRKGS